MNPWNKRLHEVTDADILNLIENNRREDRYLDYKRECGVLADKNNKNKDARADFVDDITAFANSSGGLLVIGVEELKENDAGTIALYGVDAELLKGEHEPRLRQIVTAQTDPPLPPGLLAFQSIEVDDKLVLLIQVNRSWLSPHRNKLTERYMFRDGPGNRALDALGLRAAFLRGNDEAALLRNFREERIAALYRSGRYAKGVPRYLLHVIPAGGLAGVIALDLEQMATQFECLSKAESPNRMEWKWSDYAAPVYSLDGLLIYWERYYQQPNLDSQYPMHAAFLRTGIAEVARDLAIFREPSADATRNVFYAPKLEETILWDLNTARKLLQQCGYLGPYTISLTFLEVAEFPLREPHEHRRGSSENAKFNESRLDLPVLVLTEHDPNIVNEQLIKLMWNAAGRAKSPYR